MLALPQQNLEAGLINISYTENLYSKRKKRFYTRDPYRAFLFTYGHNGSHQDLMAQMITVTQTILDEGRAFGFIM